MIDVPSKKVQNWALPEMPGMFSLSIIHVPENPTLAGNIP